MDSILTAFWLLFPAAVANMAPVLAQRIPLFDRPIDGGAQFAGQPLFGSHKTWRGICFGVLAATLVVWIQRSMYPWPADHALIDYRTASPWSLGLIFGLGALTGDLVKSFFKRRFCIAPGKPFPVFDQIDWVLGALIAASFVAVIPADIWIISVVIFGVLHVAANLIGHRLGIRAEPF